MENIMCCQDSFSRSIIQANQYLKYNALEHAKISLLFAKRYAAGLMCNIAIISELENKIYDRSK